MTKSLDPPFLRSPPFPWVAAEVAAVSVPGLSHIPDAAGLIATIRDAGVGGAFWLDGADNPWDVAEPVAGDPSADSAMVGWLRGARVADSAGGQIPDEAIQQAALNRIAASSYRDPFHDRAIGAIEAVAILGGWKRSIAANRPITAAAGMAGWKRDAIAQFLWDGRSSPVFSPPSAVGQGGTTIAYWPSRVPDGFADTMTLAGVAAWAVEDGFIRSNGLGAECRPPMSILVDRTGGIYFDPERPSELETILATHPFDDELLDRASTLRKAIVAARLGKYGVDRASPPVLGVPTDRRIVLAVGQVDDDLSVKRGGGGIAGNAAFLARVRDEEPDAYILYRPHPDVAAGLRRGRIADPVATGVVDRLVPAGSLLDLIEMADAVHVLSSLTGFEALMRGKRVTVHGSPFYAGWGLTRDLGAQPSRRKRVLSLDSLVAAVLILAPRYRDPVTELPCEPEILVERLARAPVPDTTIITSFRKALGMTRRSLAAAGGRV